jgi:eukaryotic-like serine/threonine-protein kinase
MFHEQSSTIQHGPDDSGESWDSSEHDLEETDAQVFRELERDHLGSGPRACFWVSTFRAGERVGGRYQIERFLERGGMGEIYAAFDEHRAERVALKTLLSVMADDPVSVRKLHKEFHLARRTTHPNVCRMHDIGVHAEEPRDVVHYFSMELVEGETLADRLRREPLELGESLGIASQLLRGLAAVHQAGVLHRDVKSHNILLSSDQPVRAVLSDFGLARRLDGRRRARGRPNSGSLAYMAPEQMAGTVLSPATDLFAFGVILFEMCTGSLPFAKQGSQLEGVDLDAIFDSERRRTLPPRLVAFLARCLSHSPIGRYPSAEAALEALVELQR